jgi:hypothetical protein
VQIWLLTHLIQKRSNAPVMKAKQEMNVKPRLTGGGKATKGPLTHLKAYPVEQVMDGDAAISHLEAVLLLSGVDS